jgi:hypothetical protein
MQTQGEKAREQLNKAMHRFGEALAKYDETPQDNTFRDVRVATTAIFAGVMGDTLTAFERLAEEWKSGARATRILAVMVAILTGVIASATVIQVVLAFSRGCH